MIHNPMSLNSKIPLIHYIQIQSSLDRDQRTLSVVQIQHSGPSPLLLRRLCELSPVKGWKFFDFSYLKKNTFIKAVHKNDEMSIPPSLTKVLFIVHNCRVIIAY